MPYRNAPPTRALDLRAAPVAMGIVLSLFVIGFLGFAVFVVASASSAGSSPFSVVVCVVGSVGAAVFCGFAADLAFNSFVRLDVDEARVTISRWRRRKVTETKTVARSEISDVAVLKKTNEVGRELYSVSICTPDGDVAVSPLPGRLEESCFADADAVARHLDVPRRS